ncbi:unnamed protein product [Rotaria sordida]|uniref:Uncharacterized protein n=1 Tax=Rotaria sordida TaxID=392033 RepID=A0A818SS14_9BILA|nr:unnamed protein product [Rotaria sordida]
MSHLIHLTIKFLFLFISHIHSCQWSSTQCGCAQTSASTHHRIVGGTQAKPHSWPWIVSVRQYGSHICGGVLITDRHVLTAAHCFPSYHPGNRKHYSFAMGHHRIQEKYFVAKAKRIVLHASYNTNGKSINDIALIELDQIVDFNNSRFGFICLPLKHVSEGEAYPPIGKETWVVGWGTTRYEGQVSQVLMQVTVPITTNKGCKEVITTPAKQVCAGYDKGGKDSCQGDSGGPLVLDIGQGVFELIGLVSFGIGCAKYMKPGIYTRVSSYIDWINTIIKPTKPDSISNEIPMPHALLSSKFDYRKLSYFTEEKLGQATDRTEYDDNFEEMLARADRTKIWTERLTSHVETILQPNINERLEEFILTKLDQKSLNKPNIHEQLGHCMCEAGNDFGPSTQYGSALIKCGQFHQKLGIAHKEFIQSVATSFMQPLKSFLDGEMRSLTKERRTLEIKRLDLDAAKSKKKKAKITTSSAIVAMADSSDIELRHTQAEFDRQLEITRLMLDGLNNSHNHHLRCLNDLVESELQYHRQSVQILEDLRKQLGLTKSTMNSSIAPSTSRTMQTPRTATVKFDYDASDPNELSVLAKETVNIILDNNEKLSNDADWITIERPHTKERGRIPRAYLHIDNLSS